jgi:hypothetical protein
MKVKRFLSIVISSWPMYESKQIQSPKLPFKSFKVKDSSTKGIPPLSYPLGQCMNLNKSNRQNNTFQIKILSF